jgi:hypothetical protein
MATCSRAQPRWPRHYGKRPAAPDPPQEVHLGISARSTFAPLFRWSLACLRTPPPQPQHFCLSLFLLSVLQSGNAYVPLDVAHPARRKTRALRRLLCRCFGCVVVGADLWHDERERWLRAECARFGLRVVVLDEKGSPTVINLPEGPTPLQGREPLPPHRMLTRAGANRT